MPPKRKISASVASESESSQRTEDDFPTAVTPAKRSRGRPRTIPRQSGEGESSQEAIGGEPVVPVKRPRGRPRKIQSQPSSSSDAISDLGQVEGLVTARVELEMRTPETPKDPLSQDKNDNVSEIIIPDNILEIEREGVQRENSIPSDEDGRLQLRSSNWSSRVGMPQFIPEERSSRGDTNTLAERSGYSGISNQADEEPHQSDIKLPKDVRPARRVPLSMAFPVGNHSKESVVMLSHYAFKDDNSSEDQEMDVDSQASTFRGTDSQSITPTRETVAASEERDFESGLTDIASKNVAVEKVDGRISEADEMEEVQKETCENYSQETDHSLNFEDAVSGIDETANAGLTDDLEGRDPNESTDSDVGCNREQKENGDEPEDSVPDETSEESDSEDEEPDNSANTRRSRCNIS